MDTRKENEENQLKSFHNERTNFKTTTELKFNDSYSWNQLPDQHELIRSCSKYSAPKSSKTTSVPLSCFTTLCLTFLNLDVEDEEEEDVEEDELEGELEEQERELEDLFFPLGLFRSECFLFKAIIGDPPSSRFTFSIFLSDSLTTSTGKLRTARDPFVAKAAWS